ncbi:hypothetical protein CGMCC3_g7648 [Colletotrichum fructicola]|uniref:Uncharacterized protein n=1 Tax=Colletotrichum fructicola (strain Nara gc5) TaxID=1213859 RepID=L2FDK9_COLFN|nr:uncharacterized protein CGMCC3_g7648 [Colletotrichum fructicola]KAE9576487.1 hypothetical protein CGMCC3_g7648 [Colletotrichum fructicola]
MQFLTFFSCVAAATAAATVRRDAGAVDSNLHSRALSCNACVTTVKGSSTTIWGPFPFSFDNGGPVTDTIYEGCTVTIDRKSATDCSKWTVRAGGACGDITKQQIC